MRTHLRAVSVGAMLLVLGYNSQVHAQSMDYASLQELFGEPVTTSATGTPQRASDVAADMTIITADQIRQSGSRNIPAVINEYVPGVDLLQTSYSDYELGMRGFQQPLQPRLLVLVNGRQVFIDDYSRTTWNNIPVNIDDIRQIEVVNGPSSALFGSNAASGVVNIVTYSPEHDSKNVASVSAGTQNLFSGDVTVTQNGDWGGTKISAGGLNADEFNTARTAADGAPVSPFKRYITNQSVIPLSSTVQASEEITYSNSHENAVPILNFDQNAEFLTTYSVRGGLSWSSPYGLISTDTYLNHSNDTALLSQGRTSLNTNLLVSNLSDQFKVGNDNTFRVNLEYRHKNYTSQGSTDADVFSAGGTWLSQITNQLSWTGALRLDHQNSKTSHDFDPINIYDFSAYTHSLNTLSANAALSYKLTDKDSVALTYGRGVQIPSLLQENVVYGPAPGLAVKSLLAGNPYLKPTITQSYELAYSKKVPETFSTFKIATFYELSQDVSSLVSKGITTVQGTPLLLITVDNLGNSRSYGGEIGINGSHDGFRWGGSYSFARVTDSQAVINDIDYQGAYPQHHFKVNGGYTFGKWELDANSQYVTSTSMLRNKTGLGATPLYTDGYFSLGGRIGYNINDNLVLAASATNVTRDKVKESPYPAIEREALVTLTAKF